jgi:hypothetical protein
MAHRGAERWLLVSMYVWSSGAFSGAPDELGTRCSWDVVAQLRGLGAGDPAPAAAIARVIGEGMRCGAYAGAHEAWARHQAAHRPVFMRLLRGGKLGAGDRLLICRPFFGLGNRFNALVACATMALVTNRTLVVDWGGQEQDPDATGASAPGGSLGDLFAREAFWELPREVLSAVLAGHAADSQHLVEVKQTDTFATHTRQLLCEHADEAFPHSVLLLKTHRWLPFAATNSHHRALLSSLLPSNARSPDAVAAALGSATLRPSHHLSSAAAATLSLLPGHLIAIQARVGAMSGDGASVRYPQSAALMRYVECAFAHLPAHGEAAAE